MISPRVIWLATQNSNATNVTLKISVQQGTHPLSTLSSHPTQTRAKIAQTGLFVFPENQDNVPNELDVSCPKSNSYQDVLPSLSPVTGTVLPRTDGKIPLILVHGWMGTAALTKWGDWLYPSHCYWKDFIKFYYSYNLNQRYVLYSYAYESTSQSVYNNATLFGTKINEAFQEQPISILAHSMGGMVARDYMARNQASHNVRQLITLGTPYYGVIPINCATVENNHCTQANPNYSVLPNLLSVTMEQNPSVKWAALGLVYQAGLASQIGVASQFGTVVAGAAATALAVHTTLTSILAKQPGTRDLGGGAGTGYFLFANANGIGELNDRIYSIYGCNPTDAAFHLTDQAIRRNSYVACTDGIVDGGSATYGITRAHRVEGVDHVGLLSNPAVFAEIDAQLKEWNGPVRAFTNFGGGIALIDLVARGNSIYVLGQTSPGSPVQGTPGLSDGRDVFLAKITDGKLTWQRYFSKPGNQYPKRLFLSEEVDPGQADSLIVAGNNDDSVFVMNLPDDAIAPIPDGGYFTFGNSALNTMLWATNQDHQLYVYGGGNIGTYVSPGICSGYNLTTMFLGRFTFNFGRIGSSPDSFKSRCENYPQPTYLSAQGIEVYLSSNNGGASERFSSDNLFTNSPDYFLSGLSFSPTGSKFMQLPLANNKFGQFDTFGGTGAQYRYSILNVEPKNAATIRSDLSGNTSDNWNFLSITRRSMENRALLMDSHYQSIFFYPSTGYASPSIYNTYNVLQYRVNEMTDLNTGAMNQAAYMNPMRRGVGNMVCAHPPLGIVCAVDSASGIDVYRMKSGSTPY